MKIEKKTFVFSWFENRGEGRASGPNIENAKESLYFHGLVGVVKGAGGPRIIENTTISQYFHRLGGVVKGAGGPRLIENTKISLYFPQSESPWPSFRLQL